MTPYERGATEMREKIIAKLRSDGYMEDGQFIPEIRSLPIPPDPTPSAEPVGWAVMSPSGDLGIKLNTRSGVENIRRSHETVVALYPADSVPAALPEPSEEWINGIIPLMYISEGDDYVKSNILYVIREYRKLAAGGAAKAVEADDKPETPCPAKSVPPAASGIPTTTYSTANSAASVDEKRDAVSIAVHDDLRVWSLNREVRSAIYSAIMAAFDAGRKA